MLFYHLDLRCYIVVELKNNEFKPEYTGQLSFYVTAVDETLRKESDEILEIRTKELKYIIATSYASISNEIYKGYLALENYFIEISKYSD